MLRVFFGDLYSCDTVSDWIDACGLDHKFHMFLEGTQNTVDAATYNVHKIVPQAIAYTGIHHYEEYMDLLTASLDVEHNPMTSEFIDIAGVTEYKQFETSDGLSHGSNLGGGVTNKLTIEAWSEEFLGKTRRLDYPIPDAAKCVTPKLYASNESLAANPSATIIGYCAFAITIDSSTPALGESYASAEVIVPITNTSDDILLAYYSSVDYATAVITLYRATVTMRTENERKFYIHSDFMRKITGSIYSGAITAGWHPIITSAPYTAHFANETTYAYAAKAVTSFCPFEPLNDIIPRVGCDFFNRNRAGLPITWMILNTLTHKYYTGILLEVSALFTEGYDMVADKTGQITVGVTDEGSFVDAALTDPTTSTYFTSIHRDYSSAP